MKLQIKTLNQKSVIVDIEETQTVYDLKRELSLYPDVGVAPEYQKLIYAGKILANEDKLSSYNIDVKKFIVIMVLKQPMGEPPKSTKPKETSKEESVKAETATTKEIAKDTSAVNNSSTSSPDTETEFKSPTAPTDSGKEKLVTQISNMGYPESEVRRALAASFYNPERAIEYLIEGIPTSPSTPEGDTNSDTDADMSQTPLDIFRGDPFFQTLRQSLQQNPELIDAAIHRIGETNPGLLHLIEENRSGFFSMFFDGIPSDDEEEDDEGDDDDEDDMGDDCL